MVRGNGILSQDDMALHTLERGVFLFLFDLVVQDAIGTRLDVTSAAAATRLHGNKRLLLERVHYCRVVAGHTTQFVVNIKLVSKTARTAS